jgi:aminopeptidase
MGIRADGRDGCLSGHQSGENAYELSDVPEDKMQLYMKYWMEPSIINPRPKTKWVVLRYPNHAMAQLAGMSTDSFTDFYFNVATWIIAKCPGLWTPWWIY